MRLPLARFSLGIAASAATILCSGTIVLAQDECAGAITIVNGANGPFSNVGATSSAPGWQCGAGANDIWFRYVASCTSTTVDTCNTTTLATVVQAFSGHCNGLIPIACNFGFCGQQSSITFASTIGATYFIRVGGYFGATGTFGVNVGVGGTCLPDECVAATPVGNGVNGPFNNTGATTSFAWTCAAGGNDVWFSYFAVCSGWATVDTCGATTDTVMEVFSGSCAGLISIGCDDDSCGFRASRITFAATAGTRYYLRVGGSAGTAVSFPLNITCTPRPPNDECATAIAVMNGANGPFSNVGATPSAPAWPCAGAGNDVWFRYVATCCGYLTISVCGANWDTGLEAFDGSAGCAGLVSIGCNDDSCGLQSSLGVSVATGRTYYLRIGGFAGNSGSFPLNLTCTPALPNDECAGAIQVNLGQNGPFDNLCATTSAPAWNCGANGGNDLWYRFVAACTAPHTFRTCGASFDTMIQVFNACGGQSLGCNDDAGASGPCASTTQSRLQIDLVLGSTYYIRVGGKNSSRGTFPLTVLTGTGNGSIAMTQASGCQGQPLAVTGDPTIGGTVTATISGASALPFLTWGYVPLQPLLPFCPCRVLTDGTDWQFATSINLTIPCAGIFIGTPLGVQGAELFGARGACAFPVESYFSDIYTVVVG